VCFAAITLCVTSQHVIIVVVCYIIDSVRKLLDTPSYNILIESGIHMKQFKGKNRLSKSITKHHAMKTYWGNGGTDSSTHS
jgi:hypothetical protein